MIDLRPICRDSDQFTTTVYLVHPYEGKEPWLILGLSSLNRRDGRNSHRWDLRARLGAESPERGVPTDFEHDNAYAAWLPLIAVSFDMVMERIFVFTAHIDPTPNLSDFRVPDPDYDPRKHPNAFECEDESCTSLQEGRPHTIVPEGFYSPPFNHELHEKVRGWQVEIWIDLQTTSV
jgi:hypothetical protein